MRWSVPAVPFNQAFAQVTNVGDNGDGTYNISFDSLVVDADPGDVNLGFCIFDNTNGVWVPLYSNGQIDAYTIQFAMSNFSTYGNLHVMSFGSYVNFVLEKPLAASFW